MGKYDQLAKEIVKNVGGKANVISVKHCVTRLRFHLKDESKANDDVLKQMDGVVTVMKAGGQYQVVIGNQVAQVYDAVVECLGLSEDSSVENVDDQQKQSLFDKFIDIISGIFQPILAPLSAAGVIKGLNTLFVALHWYTNSSGIYVLLNAIGDAIFTFLPVMLGFTAAKKFNLNQYIGLIIGAALCYPAIQLDALSAAGKPLFTLFAGTMMESPIYKTVLGIPFIAMNYTSTVIPVILICWFASKVEKWLKKIIPDTVKFFFVPLFTLLISLTLGFLVIGPVATFASNLIGSGIMAVRDVSPIIAGALVGGLWQILVVFGLHWGIIPIYFNNIITNGFDDVMMPFYGTTFATTAVVVAMLIKARQDKKLQKVGVPAAISGFLGITEPAIYGVLLPKKKPLVISCIVSAIVGAFYGWADLRKYAMGGMGFFELPGMINPHTHSLNNMWVAIIGIVMALILGFVLTMIFWKENSAQIAMDDEVINDNVLNQDNSTDIEVKEEMIEQPVAGQIIPLEKVHDQVFAEGHLGKGLGIIPTNGEVISPVDGTITTLFPTKHAIGITSKQGTEILIHIGMDTVQLEGKYFKSFVKNGDKVHKGQKLLTFDIDKIKEEGYSIETPVVITNSDQFLDVLELGLKDSSKFLAVIHD